MSIDGGTGRNGSECNSEKRCYAYLSREASPFLRTEVFETERLVDPSIVPLSVLVVETF